MAQPITEQMLRSRYEELTAELEALEKKIAPLRGKLRVAADEAEEYRVKAMKIRAQLDEARGGRRFFDLKKERARIAKMLGGQ